MILQINAIELAAELAHKALLDRHNTIRYCGGLKAHSEDYFFENENYKPLFQEEFNNLCDEYMELITNAQDVSLNNPIGNYFPIAYTTKDDIDNIGFAGGGLEDEAMLNIANKLGEIYRKVNYPNSLFGVVDFYNIPKLNEDVEES